jgi:hypothetical protein
VPARVIVQAPSHLDLGAPGPEADPTGQAASMELTHITGRGPELVTDLRPPPPGATRRWWCRVPRRRPRPRPRRPAPGPTIHAIDLDITIFNPTLDPDGRVARSLVDALVAALTHEPLVPPGTAGGGLMGALTG